MSINSVTISGNITRDAELREPANGFKVLNFCVAVNERKKQGDEWVDYANFIDCTMYGKRAESLAGRMTKGTKVSVAGRLHWSQWERDGKKQSKIEVIVDEIELLSKQESQQPAQASLSDYDLPF